MRSDRFYEENLIDFYTDLADEISTNRSEAKKILSELCNSELFEVDFVYRIVVNTLIVTDYYVSGDYKKIISEARTIVEKALTLGLWEIATRNLNILGAAYQTLDKLEKASGCYHEIIQIEEEHQYIDMSPLAYNNVGLMYLNLKAYDRSVEYLNKAIELEEKSNNNDKKHTITLIYFKLQQIIVLFKMGYIEEAREFYQDISNVKMEDFSIEVKGFYVIAKMNYLFQVGKYEEARAFYLQSLSEQEEERYNWKRALISEFLDLCKEKSLSYDFYLEAIFFSVSLLESAEQYISPTVFDSLRKYYKEIGNWEQYSYYTEKYLEILEKRDEKEGETKLASLDLIENLLEESQTVLKMKTLNSELKMVAEEALTHKKKLQKLNKRLNLISEIGRKMTSSLELSKVIDMVYQIVHENIPVDTFIIVLAEPEKNQLRALTYYDDGELQENFSVCMDNPNSFFVNCYKTEKAILSNNIAEDERFVQYHKIYIGDDSIRSVIYIPLKVEGKMVGVCSVQSRKIGMYQKDYLDFLTLFVPYLSIAINNAVYSKKLEEAIQLQLKVQGELKKANRKLEQISSLDGLTKISNRRDFEKRILGLISQAVKEESTVAIFMADIDYFKVYNDTYGHLEGDEALKKVAAVIRKVLERSGGFSARFGGEEFVGAISGLTKEEVFRTAQKICEGVRKLGILNEKTTEGILTISVGVAFMVATKGIVKSQLMKEADDALYKAKKTGKNQVILTVL